VRFQIGRVDHDRLPIRGLGSQPLEDPGEHTHLAPPLPAVVERLGRPLPGRRITPPQAIATDEDYAAQHASIVNPWLAMALWKERSQPRHLLVAQPEKIAHHAPISSRA